MLGKEYMYLSDKKKGQKHYIKCMQFYLQITWISNAKTKLHRCGIIKELTYITYWQETDTTEQNNFQKMGRSSTSICGDLALRLHQLHAFMLACPDLQIKNKP